MTTKTKRMTTDLRNRIKQNVIRDTFKDRLTALIAEEKKLGDMFYQEALPKEHLELMNKLPQGYFHHAVYARPRQFQHPMSMEYRVLYTLISGSHVRYDSSGLVMSESRVIPIVYQYGQWTEASPATAEAIEKWRNEYVKLFKEAQELEQKVDSALLAVKTVKALLETWPECKQYIPDDAFAADDRSLPTVVIADLNEAIVKAKSVAPAASESIAAAVVNELVAEAV